MGMYSPPRVPPRCAWLIHRESREDTGGMTVDELVSALPPGVVLTDPDVLEAYRFDWSRDSAAGKPVAVVRATDTGAVQETLRWATRHRVPVVPRGAGTGLAGGSSAVDGGI